MKCAIACLLVLAVAAQAQYYGGYGLGGYGLGGYGGYYGGYYPYAGVRATTAYPAMPETAAYPVAYGYPSFSASQYHAQDELDQASFGYAHPGQAASNYRDGLGNQIGSYAYINPEGKEVRVSYTADSRGFRVLSNDLPVAPVANLVAPVQVQDTPEVTAAKADHAAAVAAVKSGVVPASPAVALPVPVQDTPEVAAAKAEFAIKFAEAKAAATPAVRTKRQIFSYPYGATPFAYPGYAVSPYTYSVAAPATPVREATLTRTILTPGHAVAYRVD